MTKLTPKQIEGSIGNNKIVKKLDDGTFAEVTTSDIEALGFSIGGGGTVEKTETFVAGEDIDAGEHVSLNGSLEEQRNDNINIGYDFPLGVTNANINIGHTFTTLVGNTIKNIKTKIQGKVYSDNLANYTFQAKVYAVSGTVGSTALPTGPALISSDIVTFSTNTSVPWQRELLFTFPPHILNGNYAISIEGTLSSITTFEDFYFKGGSSGSHYGNSYKDGVTESNDIYFIVELEGYASLSSANSIGLSKYIGQATESKLSGESINVKTRGVINQTGATADGEYWYLSNTTGTISTTAGTNKVFIGRGIGTDIISLRGVTDFCIEPSHINDFMNQSVYFSGGGLITFGLTFTGGGLANGTLNVDFSEDGVNWYTIEHNTSQGTFSHHGSHTISVPKNTFVRFGTSGTWSANVSNLRAIYF